MTHAVAPLPIREPTKVSHEKSCTRESIALRPWYHELDMATLNSSSLYPVNLTAGGIPTNLVKNRTPDGKFQIARVKHSGSPLEGDFEVLWEGDNEVEAEMFARTQAEKESPGILSSAP